MGSKQENRYASNCMTRRSFGKAAALAGGSLLAPSEVLKSASGESRQPQAGTAQSVVNPTAKGTVLIGPMKPSTGIHDDLYARAIVLSDGTTDVALITLDYLGFDFHFTEKLLDAVEESTGIPPDRIPLNCSHTHSAPITAPWGPWEKEKDQLFHQTLLDQVPAVVAQARQRLQPVLLRYRREPTQIGFNRRLLHQGRIVMAPNPQGTILP